MCSDMMTSRVNQASTKPNLIRHNLCTSTSAFRVGISHCQSNHGKIALLGHDCTNLMIRIRILERRLCACKARTSSTFASFALPLLTAMFTQGTSATLSTKSDSSPMHTHRSTTTELTLPFHSVMLAEVFSATLFAQTHALVVRTFLVLANRRFLFLWRRLCFFVFDDAAAAAGFGNLCTTLRRDGR